MWTAPGKWAQRKKISKAWDILEFNELNACPLCSDSYGKLASTVLWSWTTPWLSLQRENQLPSSWPLDQALKTMTHCKWIANDGIKPPGNPCGRDACISVIPQVSWMQVMGYLLHIEEGSPIQGRKSGGNYIETGRDSFYLTVSSTWFSTVLSHSASYFGLLHTCTVSYPVSLKGCTCWDSLHTYRVSKDALPPPLLTDSLAKYRQNIDNNIDKIWTLGGVIDWFWRFFFSKDYDLLAKALLEECTVISVFCCVGSCFLSMAVVTGVCESKNLLWTC